MLILLNRLQHWYNPKTRLIVRPNDVLPKRIYWSRYGLVKTVWKDLSWLKTEINGEEVCLVQLGNRFYPLFSFCRDKDERFYLYELTDEDKIRLL